MNIAKGFDIISMVMGIVVTGIIFSVIYLIGRLIRKRKKLKISTVKEQLLESNKNLASTNKVLQDLYYFFDELENKKLEGGQK